MNWYLKVLKQYVDFGGRARRTEFWMFTLINVVISIVLAIVDSLVFDAGSFAALSGGIGASVSLGVLGTIYSLAVLVPSIAVTVRRLHDTDRSGWWILIGLVPLVGGIVLLVFMVLEGTRGPNSHGADPKAAAGAAY